MVVQSATTGKVGTRLPQGQVRTFIVAATGHPLDAMFFLALTASKREEEILDLTWMDED